MDKNLLNLYSRQIYTYGLDVMDDILKLKILIIGLRGLGIEIAKNIILAGPKEVSISDKNICKINDLGSNFYVSEEDVNKKTLEDACYDKLNELNPYVTISKHKGLFKEDITKFNLIIITEIMKLEELYELNNICRRYNKKFIYTLNLGLTGYLFNDFGEEHTIYDLNGEKKISYEIFNIEERENENKYEIFLNIKDDEELRLKEGDYVVFKKVKGLEFLNDLKQRKIIKIKDKSLEIEKDNECNGKYLSDGIIERIKNTKMLKFKSFKDNFLKLNNSFIKIDDSKAKSNILLHCAFVGLHIYYSSYGILPELNNLEQIKDIVELSKKYYLILSEKYEECLKIKQNIIVQFDENYIIKVLRWSKAEINPICSFLGGIVSQEALKITGKYTPVYQWLRFDFFETIENLPNNINRNLLNCRYDDQIAIFGQELQEKLGELNLFMVGAGALGCEYIKNFSLMGISCNKGKITITDHDNISLSNLNRQFLFHRSDIKENSFKSFCAKREALKINNNMNIKDYPLFINDDSRDIFNDEFIESQNILISAVDNLQARKYLDNLATFFNKIYMNSGTEGTKANSDIYYPNKSICMNDLKFIEKKEIPQCTLRTSPSKIEHCIELGKTIFKELFEQYIKDIALILEDKKQFDKILNEKKERSKLYLDIEIYKNILYILEKPSQYSIIKYALFIFTYYFEYLINKLLKEHSYSDVSFIKTPSPLKLNLSDENTILFFESFYYILSDIINFNEKFELKTIKEVISKEQIFIREEILDNQIIINNFQEEISNLLNENIVKERIHSIKQIKLEKDNDENYHINFILSFSNLRANNFNIENTDFLNVKEIAGNIIPAIASTTSAITGISCLQIYTLLQTDDLDSFRNCDLNLATSNFDLYIPEEKRYEQDIINNENILEKKVIPGEFTVWDKIDIIGPNKTVENIVVYFKDNYNVDIDFINYKNYAIASPINGNKDFHKTIESLLKKYIKINENTKYIKLEISGCIDDVDVRTPSIRYILKSD